MKVRFDTIGFHEALDARRRARRITWKRVAKESGVSASTLSRMAHGQQRPDVDGLAALLTWSDLRAEDFIRKSAIRRR